MPVNHVAKNRCTALLCILLMALLLLSGSLSAWAQDGEPTQAQDSGGITYKICRPDTCFGTEEAKQRYAE